MSETTPMPRASDVLRSYVNAWLQSDPEKLAATLADDAVVMESHGPTFLGKAEIVAWIERWAAAGDQVHRWELLSVVESDDGAMVAAEWDFACTAAGVDYEILGATIATVDHGCLTRITEYRREVEDP